MDENDDAIIDRLGLPETDAEFLKKVRRQFAIEIASDRPDPQTLPDSLDTSDQ
jgi:hypothetical protein